MLPQQLKPQAGEIKPGDWLTLCAGAACCIWLALQLWGSNSADTAIVRSGGKIVQELPLSKNAELDVKGPLGISRISVNNHQARISKDPSPRQYCVKQGWLKQAGEVAICLPNQISLELKGSRKQYDSINY